jgi:hypothetical protein
MSKSRGLVMVVGAGGAFPVLPVLWWGRSPEYLVIFFYIFPLFYKY